MGMATVSAYDYSELSLLSLTRVISLVTRHKTQLDSVFIQRVADNSMKPSCPKFHLPTSFDLNDGSHSKLWHE